MPSDMFGYVIPALIPFASLVLLLIQLRRGTKQKNLESLYRVYDVSRQLLSLGFTHPALFDVLNDAPDVNPEWEKRYLQMWLNQLSMVHTYLKNGSFDPEFHDSLHREIAYLMTLQNMQRHWKNNGDIYSPSFQKLVNGILEKKA